MKNKVSKKHVPLESSHSTDCFDLAEALPAPDMLNLKSSTVTMKFDQIPIFHLSFPVRNLDETKQFYCKVLGASIGRAD